MAEIHVKSLEREKSPFGVFSLTRLICECVKQTCLSSFKSLEGLVLTGSMARDEASFIYSDGCWAALGDAEFIARLKDGAQLPDQTALCSAQNEIEKRLLKQHQIRCKIDLGFVYAHYFRRLPPHIFTYELKHCGKVLWGEDRILAEIPDFSVGDLSRTDAWHLLCNRLIELLECAGEFSCDDGTPNSEKLTYRITKLYLDMATSLLIFLGAYAPSYRDRNENLRRLAKRPPANDSGWPFDLSRIVACVDYCTQQKLCPREKSNSTLDLRWSEAIQMAHWLWRWELAQLACVPRECSDRKLFDGWTMMQPVRERIRGWAYVMRATRWHRSYRLWPHWIDIARRMSPRYAVYLAASLAAFKKSATPDLPDDREHFAKLGDLLPLRSSSGKIPHELDFVALASDVVVNYRRFLIGTRS